MINNRLTPITEFLHKLMLIYMNIEDESSKYPMEVIFNKLK